VTNDFELRLHEHYFGRDEKESFAKKHKCFYLVLHERHQYVNNAIESEKVIKGWTREKKNKLIAEEDQSRRFLNVEILEWPPPITNDQ
jgi:putative endonuclease